MKFDRIFLSFTLLCVTLPSQTLWAQKNAKPGPLKLVVVGDSLSAGVQNFSLLDTQQPNGFASIIARQANLPLSLPLVPFPGVPNVLQLVSFGPPVNIQPAPGSVPAPRDNPGVQPNNIAVPGLTVASALTLRPSLTATTAEQVWATIVLGFPSLPAKAPTEIELAQSLKPQLLIEWLGNNDALVPALVGQVSALTPPDQFEASYERVLDELKKTNAQIVTATVPDVTEVPFFTSAQSVADQAGIPLTVLTQVLGIGPHDYVRPTALTFIDAILTGAMPGPLPASCPAPLPDLGASTLPCVLTQADANTVRQAVNCYNQIIAKQTKTHAGVLVDIHALVDTIYTNGYKLGSQTLTADFFGGLFSLDGIHPTNTGYGVIANEFIRAMNRDMGSNIQAADVSALFASDPLAVYAQPHFAPRSLPAEPACACKVD